MSAPQRLPAVFLGHGSPMNAVSDNDFTRFLSGFGKELPRPRAILAVSAHWVTDGTKVEKAERPETIHDFYGFPEELFRIQYPAPGSPADADEIARLLTEHEAATDGSWGLDHGTWSVLRHMYPAADIPVLQLSLNANLPLRDHYELAKDLRPLREKGLLIVGSGNITHNLRRLDPRPGAPPMDWAVEFDAMIAKALEERDLPALLAEEPEKHSLWRTAHPTLEHYLPLLYTLGVSDENETPAFPHEEMQLASLSMRAVRFG